MKAFDLLKDNINTLKLLEASSVVLSDIKYLEAYEEYNKLLKEGHKVTYVIQYLCDEYNTSEATLYRVIKRLSKDIVIKPGEGVNNNYEEVLGKDQLKCVDVLTFYKDFFVKLTRNGIGLEDIQYIGVVTEYNKMLDKGQKEAQIRTLLSKEYKLSQGAIKKAVTRLNEVIKI